MNNALNPSGGISVSPADLQTLLNLYQTAKWGELERTCVALVNRLPHVGVVWSFLGASVKAQGRLQEALEPHRKAADLLPNDAQVHFNFAVLLQELGQTEAATAAYLHALTIAPTWVECLFNLGLLSQRTGDATTARKHYQKALTVDPAYAPALFSLAVIDHQAGALSDAENGYRRLIEAHPQIAEAHYNLGNLLKDQQKLAEAAASYEVALQRNPGLAYAAASLGEVYRLQGDVRSATQWLAKALAMDQKLPDAHYSMGQLLVEQHQFEAAIAAFNRSLELRPDFAEAHVGLGGVLQQAGMYEQAEVAYTAAENLGHAGASVRKALMMPAIMGQWEDIHQSRSRLENRLEALINSGIHLHDPLREVGRTNFYLAYHGLNDKDLQVSIANFYTKVCPSLLEVDRVIPNSESRERVKKKPRVGFFSAFLYEHAISACFKNIIISLSLIHI